MSDLTYAAKGTFDRNGKIDINVCIPPELQPGTYRTEFYNLSKIISHGSINAIFCHFSNGGSDPINHNSFDYRLKLDAYAMKSHSGATDFDENSDNSLFLFFHNDPFTREDRAYYFDNLEAIYDEIKHNGNQSQEGMTSHATQKNPRRIGMSLIIKAPIVQ